jgi:cob(I)alamin adenosyltransferase
MRMSRRWSATSTRSTRSCRRCGGSFWLAGLPAARSVGRRAERRDVGLGDGVADRLVVTYLNRLSDLLFVMARAANRRAGVLETEW